ncbi:hypothetical protein ALNOE001_16120 [Candidatus Methanobinarius endosymbioticus]|uniref:Uncharacterized protein n=1 Tax=Candidatus Methanobinarius endosymbioticus TaxID=2006182 RepID=A0A366M9D3_9EURY|nr:hypothetical protein ALNOE001_16120 [Candidatus Methanobinarius endosymbioticus]
MIPVLQIEDLDIRDNLFTLSISLKFKHFEDFKPHLKIIFSNDIENRRFPFEINSFNKDDISECCFLSASGTFEIDHIFWNKSFIGNIYVDFSLLYGNEFIENFSVINKVPDIIFNNNESKFEKEYYLPVLKDNNLILNVKKESLENKFKNKNKKIYKFSMSFIRFFLLLISILAFPFFFTEGYLISKGVKNKSSGYLRGNSVLSSILFHINERTLNLSGYIYSKRTFKIGIMKFFYLFTKNKKIIENRVLFLSERNNEINGNFEFVYNLLKDNNDLNIVKFLVNKKIKDLNLYEMIKFVNLISSSKIILLDDFYPNIHNFTLKNETKLIQLWHAVGAFKTFGFSRLGKEGGVDQDSANHRSYDYSIASSDEIKKFYAEGFAISDNKVEVTGIPRTDVFFNKEYKRKIRTNFYNKFPHLKDKNIILFAPTFRGDGKDDAFYPMDKFDLEFFIKSINDIKLNNHKFDDNSNYNFNNHNINLNIKNSKKNQSNLHNNVEDKTEYVLIIKHHPFIKEKTKIPEKYKDNIIDLSKDYEINDLLFTIDVLITDYSSVIFEAALLNIPMLFYAHDLEEYSKNRGFYYDYNACVPGKISNSLEKIIKAINSEDFDKYKVKKFKNKFFNDFDGKSSQRVIELINKLLND